MDESESITKGLRFMSEDLVSIADRIGAQMVELPRDADGKPIHLGDTVYNHNGREREVTSLRLQGEDCPMWMVSAGVDGYVSPRGLTHECPDSLKRIADEIEGAIKWCDVNGNHFTGMSSIKDETLAEWADRIRRLAEREG